MEQESIKFQLVARPYRLEDYPYIENMWNEQGENAPPMDVLGKDGIVITYEDNIVCAIFIFQPSSSMGMIEFQIANPLIDKEIRNEGIDVMIEKAVEICKKIGYKYIYTATYSEKFKKRLESNGFAVKGAKQYHMFWGL